MGTGASRSARHARQVAQVMMMGAMAVVTVEEGMGEGMEAAVVHARTCLLQPPRLGTPAKTGVMLVTSVARMMASGASRRQAAAHRPRPQAIIRAARGLLGVRIMGTVASRSAPICVQRFAVARVGTVGTVMEEAGAEMPGATSHPRLGSHAKVATTPMPAVHLGSDVVRDMGSGACRFHEIAGIRRLPCLDT